MNKEPNKNEHNEEAKVLSDQELDGIVGGAPTFAVSTFEFNGGFVPMRKSIEVEVVPEV